MMKYRHADAQDRSRFLRSIASFQSNYEGKARGAPLGYLMLMSDCDTGTQKRGARRPRRTHVRAINCAILAQPVSFGRRSSRLATSSATSRRSDSPEYLRRGPSSRSCSSAR